MCLSNAAHTGFMTGQKDAEKDESSGSAEVITDLSQFLLANLPLLAYPSLRFIRINVGNSAYC